MERLLAGNESMPLSVPGSGRWHRSPPTPKELEAAREIEHLRSVIAALTGTATQRDLGDGSVHEQEPVVGEKWLIEARLDQSSRWVPWANCASLAETVDRLSELRDEMRQNRFRAVRITPTVVDL